MFEKIRAAYRRKIAYLRGKQAAQWIIDDYAFLNYYSAEGITISRALNDRRQELYARYYTHPLRDEIMCGWRRAIEQNQHTIDNLMAQR